MFLLACLISFAFSATIFGQISAQATARPPNARSPTPSPTPKRGTEPREKKPLADIIEVVKKAVDEYQDSLGGGKSNLPPLQSAEFDFKVVTEDNIKGGISLFIFSFGASTAKSTVNDVAYTYELPKPGAKALSEEPLNTVLARTIKEAARAVKESGAMGDLKFTKLVVEIQFGVKWTVDVHGNATYQFVTLNLGAGKSNNTVHSVKLTFKEPEKQKATPTCTPTPTP